MARVPRRRRPKFQEPVTVPMQSVAHFVRMLQNQDKFHHFVDAAKGANAQVLIDPSSADFLQEFLQKHDLHEQLAAAVVDPCPNKPFC